MAKGKGIEVSILPQDVGDKLQEFYDGKQFPFVRRNSNGLFSVMVHSVPFGRSRLTPAEIAQREAQKARDKKQRQAKVADKKKKRDERKAKEASDKAARKKAKINERIARKERELAEIRAK